MERITVGMLQATVDRINRMTGSPDKPWLIGEDGKHHANIGNYHLDGAYSGYALHRMVNDGGGIEAITNGYRPRRELLDMMHAYIRGLEAKAVQS
jgi:hypothetical protein